MNVFNGRDNVLDYIYQKEQICIMNTLPARIQRCLNLVLILIAVSHADQEHAVFS